jgi:hypothetical protein
MSIINELKDAAGIFKEIGKIKEYKQILDAMKELTDQQVKISELIIQNQELKQKLKIREDLVARNNAYWTKDGDGPFCFFCHGNNDKLIRMTTYGTSNHFCNICKMTPNTGRDINKIERMFID